jgi:sugar lactone lactonase YvrE
VPATSAQLNSPQGLAFDAEGNLYVADSTNNRIRRIANDANKTISTVVGTGTAGSLGDSGAANLAQLNSPYGVAFDAVGNLYITDTGNNRVRKVTARVVGGLAQPLDGTETITPVAGTGTAGYYPGPGQAGPALSAQLNNCQFVAIDKDGNIFIADSGNNCIRKVDTTGTITTFVGGLLGPGDLRVDAEQNLFIADAGNYRVVKVAADLTITPLVNTSEAIGFSGDGFPATGAQLKNPFNLTLDGYGNLFVADSGNGRVRFVNMGSSSVTPLKVVDPATGATMVVAPGNIATVAGGGAVPLGDNGPAVAAHLSGPRNVAFDGAGNLYFTDTDNNLIRKIANDADGTITTVVGNGKAGFSNTQVNNPVGIVFDPAWKTFYFADAGNQCVRRVDTTTGLITTVAGTPGAKGSSGDTGPATQARFSTPRGIVLDAHGNLFIVDSGNNRVRLVTARVVGGVAQPFDGSASEIITTVAGDGSTATLKNPFGIALDASGNPYVADLGNSRVRFVNMGVTPPSIATIAGGGWSGTTTAGSFTVAMTATKGLSQGLAVSGTGIPSGATVVSIVENTSITLSQAATTSGPTTLFFGDGAPATAAQLAPRGVAVDGAGDVFISDGTGNRIWKVRMSTGLIATVAGTGATAYSGDGGPATQAQVNFPFLISIDPAGNLYIPEIGSNRIRRLNVAAKALAVNLNADGAGNVEARLEVDASHDASALASVTLRTVYASDQPSLGKMAGEPTVDASGHLTPSVAGTDLGPDPADPLNVQKRVFGFGPSSALPAGQAYRLEWAFAGGRNGSGDTHYSIAWSTPADITYGTPLDGTQLNATASVPGTFTYNYDPAAGTVLSAGAQPLTAHFVPLDTTFAPADWTVVLNVLPRPVTVTADGQTKTYGSADPSLTSKITCGSLVAGDSLTGALGRAAGENVGTYAINQGTLAASGNYALTFVAGTLTVTARPITVTADNQTKTYGNADPSLTYKITCGSLVGADSLTGALTRAPGENVSTYAINQGTLTAGSNYALTFVGATLTITARPITVTADNKTKILNSADPTFTYSITSGSLVAPDGFTGALARAPGENVGTYTISQGTLAASGNYTLTFVPGTLSVGYSTTQGRQVLSPINGDGSSVFSLRTVPVKFQVFDANGSSVGPDVSSNGTAGPPTSLVLTSGSQTVPAAGTFHWDPTNQQWVCNLSTNGLSSGAYVGQINLNDGTTIGFQFTVTK